MPLIICIGNLKPLIIRLLVCGVSLYRYEFFENKYTFKGKFFIIVLAFLYEVLLVFLVHGECKIMFAIELLN